MTVGELNNFVGVQITRSNGILKLNQTRYIKDMLSKYRMDDSKSLSLPMDPSVKLSKIGNHNVISEPINAPYRHLVGSLLYAALSTRIDISYPLNVLSRFSNAPTKTHWIMLKNILRYLKSREDYGLVNLKSTKTILECYTDSDSAGCIDTRRSTSSFIILLNKTPTIWKSTRQTVATSTCEAEFIAASSVCKELLWVRNILLELGISLPPIPVRIDNQGTIKLIKNNQAHNKTKHLDIKLHFIRDVNGKDIELVYVSTEENVSDVLTKPLPARRLNELINLLSLRGEKPVSRIEDAVIAEVEEIEQQNIDYIMNRRLLAFALVLISLGTVEPFLLGPSQTMQGFEVLLSYKTPCDFMLDEPLQKEKQLVENQESTKPKCYSEKLYQYEGCKLKENKLTSTIAKFPQITRIHDISKRDIIDDVYSGVIKLGKVVISAATIWVKSVPKTVMPEIAYNITMDSVSELFNSGRKSYENWSLVPYDVVIDEILRMSIVARDHPEIMDQHTRDYVGLDRVLDYFNDEFITAETLLAGVFKYLRNGRIDTHALSQLINSSIITTIDPMMTKVKHVYHVPEKDSVKFVFEVVRELSFWNRLIKTDIFIMLIITFMILVISYLAYSSYIQANLEREPTINISPTPSDVITIETLRNFSISHLPSQY